MGLYTGKNVLLTGAAGIIGSKLSERLAEEGANLILLDIDKSRLENLVGKVRDDNNVIAEAYPVDITCESSLNDVLGEIEKRFNSIDVLYSNAAGKTKDLKEFFKPYSKFESSAWKEIMDVNLNSMFYITKYVGENMIKNNNQGAIVMTSSIYGILGVDDRIYKGSNYLNHEINTPAVYSTTKAGIIGLCKYLATYWGKHGIRVNAIAPGGVFSGQNKLFEDNYSARVPLGRMANVEEIIEPMIFLGSNMASYINGQVLAVDGGLSAW